ncbi:MAG: hypothetical protein R2716_10485 [Microthrixaceae bacterium]
MSRPAASLARRASALGVATEYVDAGGVRRSVPASTVEAVCELLHDPTADGRSAEDPLDHVVVVRGGRVVSGVRDRETGLRLQVTLEDGSGPAEVTLDDAGERNAAATPLGELPLGLHTLCWSRGHGSERRSTVVVAPHRFPALAGNGRLTAVFVPAYAPWSRDDPGPSLGLLDEVAGQVAPLGADCLATLPLFATGLGRSFDPSPYSPVSRFHLNELLGCTPGPARQSRELTGSQERVDWSSVVRDATDRLGAAAAALDEAAQSELEAFLATRPDVSSYAELCATEEVPARVHELGQWLAEGSMCSLVEKLHARGVSFALDLPVGCRPGGWEQRRWPGSLRRAQRSGTPGRVLPGRPGLGSPATRPDPARVWVATGSGTTSSQARHARGCAAHRPRHAGAAPLVGARRASGRRRHLCELPRRGAAGRGGVGRPAHRHPHGGEDLGTVPPQMAALMDDWGLPGMYEELFALHDLSVQPDPSGQSVAQEADADGAPPALPAVPPGSWAGLRTHDMAPVAAVARELDPGAYRRALGASIGHPVGPDVGTAGQGMLERLHSSAAGRSCWTSTARSPRRSHTTCRAPSVPGTGRTAWPSRWRSWARIPHCEAPSGALRRTGDPGGGAMTPQQSGRSDQSAVPGTGPSDDGCPVGELDLHLLFEGTHNRLHESMGAQPAARAAGSRCGPRARRPCACSASTTGGPRTTGWTRGSSGVWSTFLEGPGPGHAYHYRVTTPAGEQLDKADPYAAATSEPPATTSRIAELAHEWTDGEWMESRGARIALDAPVSIYEVHLGSWGRTLPGGESRFPSYLELADPLADHVLAHGFSHVELMPPTEHPFYGSWGYQTTGYFAPTARYGTPAEFMEMVDRLHRRGSA